MAIDLDTIEILGDELDHPEGVAYWDGAWYAGGEAGQVWRVGPDGRMAQVAALPGFLLGIALDGDGRIYACDTKSRVVWQVSADGHRIFSQGTSARPMVNPNWGVFSSTGIYYVSDSGHWKRNDGVVYRVDGVRGGTEVWLEHARHFPNGLALHPDGEHLYIVESTLPGISRVRIAPTGEPRDYAVVLRLERTVPDGIAFDRDGGLYIGYYRPDRIDYWPGHGSAEVFAEDWQGTVISAPTNLAFGGADGRDLVFASLGRWSLGRVRAPAPGAPLWHPRLP